MVEIINTIVYLYRYIYRRLFTRFYRIGWPVAFGRNFDVKNASYVSLGNHVFFGNEVFIQVPKEHADFGLDKPKLIIEDKVSISHGTYVNAVKKINIKKSVTIAQNCYIGDNDHEYRDITKPIMEQGVTNASPVVIGEGSWIGSKVTICSGVSIGKNCVVGANSVVTKDIPDYSVAVGMPAKVIKQFSKKTKKWEKVK